MEENKYTRYVLIEKHFKELELTNLNFINKQENLIKNVVFAIDNLSKVITFISEQEKESLIERLISNSEYDSKGDEAHFDFYDWNDYILYYEFAKYKKTRKNPLKNIQKDSIFNDEYFGNNNIKEFQEFLNGNHHIFSLYS